MTQHMILIACAVLIIIGLLALVKLRNIEKNAGVRPEDIKKIEAAAQQAISETMKSGTDAQMARQDATDRLLETRLRAMQDMSEAGTAALKESVAASLQMTDTVVRSGLEKIDAALSGGLEQVDRSVGGMASTVKEQLSLIRKTVDDELSEHLDRKLTESFSQVTTQLESVYKGLGEMQALAQGVGDLKKVLSNTKTRGILGEAQLGAIISDILTPEQYEENAATVKGSSERVEFAVKLPTDDGYVYLPIDAKFPGDTYAAVQDAYASGDTALLAKARKALSDRLKSEAKDIREKYVREPETTGFGIMFLPFEGLYAEAVNMGMVEILSREFRVNIAGPSTMAALLCSLQMSFRTIAIQKRSQEVWDVLTAVKSEFGIFSDALEKVETKINQAGSEVGKLRGTRMRAMERKFRGIESSMAIGDADKLLGIGAPELPGGEGAV